MLPTLYGKASTNKIKHWAVTTDGDEVVVSHGQVGGKITEKRTTSKPKNIGKANETTGAEQATLEAQSKWNKQIKKDYRESVEDIPESTLPNLAHKYQDKSHVVDWDNTYEAVKLDGVRGSVFIKDSEIFFQSRGGEAYPIIQEIADELQKAIFDHIPNAYVDGEFFRRGMFLEDITACVKKPNEDTKKIQFHIFDLVDLDIPEQPWIERYGTYTGLLAVYHDELTFTRILPVKARKITSEAAMKLKHRKYVNEGYEGIILRDTNAKYSFGNRTVGIIKYKIAESEEFVVVDFECDKNGAGVPVCRYYTPEGEPATFKAPFATTAEKRKELWANRETLKGCHLTVDFEKLSKYGVPTKPISKAFREMDEYGNPKV